METRVKYVVTTEGKKVVGRILPGSDVLAGIEKIAAEQGIKNGWVDAIGSLKAAKFCILEKLPDNYPRVGMGYGDPIEKEGPVELISAHGMLVNGAIHLHGTMCGDDGVVFGGHMIKDANPVLVTCEVCIQEAQNLNCARGDDGEVDGMQYFPEGL